MKNHPIFRVGSKVKRICMWGEGLERRLQYMRSQVHEGSWWDQTSQRSLDSCFRLVTCMQFSSTQYTHHVICLAHYLGSHVRADTDTQKHDATQILRPHRSWSHARRGKEGACMLGTESYVGNVASHWSCVHRFFSHKWPLLGGSGGHAPQKI